MRFLGKRSLKQKKFSPIRTSSQSIPILQPTTSAAPATLWRFLRTVPIRRNGKFRRFTEELSALSDWLPLSRIKTMAMDTTGSVRDSPYSGFWIIGDSRSTLSMPGMSRILRISAFPRYPLSKKEWANDAPLCNLQNVRNLSILLTEGV